MSNYNSTKVIELGSCAFRQWRATESHCQWTHGYLLTAKFIFGGHKLDHRNWILNFGGFKKLKETLNKQFDHTLCVAADDPELETFKLLHDRGACDLRIMDAVGVEKTAEFCFNAAREFINAEQLEGVWVESVEVFEHDKNSAIFTRDPISLPTVDFIPGLIVSEEEKTFTATGNLDSTIANGANVGTNTSSGLSDPFKGTSWGN